MDDKTHYTTVRIKRETKFDIERLAALHWREKGEKVDAGDIIEIAIKFLKNSAFKITEEKL